MKSFRYRLLIAALAVLMGTVAGHSQTADTPPNPPMHGHHMAMGMGMGGHMGFLAKQLNLTDQEKRDLVAFLKALSGEGWQGVKAPVEFPK